jgi:D-galactarolactone cycloisomerase
MTIASIDARIVRVPFDHHDDLSTGRAGNLRLSTMNTLLVRVETRGGLVGWGEAFGFNLVDATKSALDTVVGPLCVGQDAGDTAALNAMLHRRLHNYGRNGPVSFAIAGIDIAVWDIAGKAAGKPLHAMLGPGGHRVVPAYASLLRYGNADTVARNVARAASRGYSGIKLHEVEPDVIRAGRKAAPPDVSFTLDVNCAWQPDEAIAFARSIVDCGLAWLEEPVWPPEDVTGLARVARESPIPLAAGENITTLAEFERMFAAGAIRYAQPSMSKVGVTGMLAIAAAAGRHGITLAPHSPYFGPGLLATIHMAAAARTPIPVERYGCDLEADLFDDAATPVRGLVTVPAAPGLGRDPSPEVMRRFG